MKQARKSAGWLRIFAGTACAAALFSMFTGEARAYCVPGPDDRPEQGLQGATLRSELNVAGGFQGHRCGVRDVGHEPLGLRGSFGDIQLIGLCAYASMRNPSDLSLPTTGTSVVDMRVPSQPVWTQTLRTPAMQRAYSALELQENIMVAAFKDFGPSGNNWFDIYDVSGDCLNPTHLATTTTASGNHDGWLTPDTNTYYGVPFGGQTIQQNPDRIDVHVLDMSDKANPVHLLNWNRNQLPPDVRDRLVPTRNFHDVSTNDAGTRVYLALYGGNNALGGSGPNGTGRCANGLLVLDSSDVALRRPNPQLRYVSFLSWCDQQIDPDFGDGSTAASHATEYVIHENGKEYVISTDESGGGLGGSASGICAHRTYGRFIDISDEANPRVVSTFKPDVNKPENCAQNLAENTVGGMLHYIGFDDRYKMRLVYYAAANQGLRVVDFRDPENPKEVAYYKAPNVASTAQGSMDFTRPDPRIDNDNCLVYTGWNQGGLRIVELTNPEYNACMRREASGGGWLAGRGPGALNFGFEARRADDGHGALEGSLQLNDRAGGARIHVGQMTYLSGVRGPCGDVLPTASSVQFEGAGTFNGAPATFRVCVQDNGEGGAAATDQFYLACTSGCSYSAGGALGGGNVEVKQR